MRARLRHEAAQAEGMGVADADGATRGHPHTRSRKVAPTPRDTVPRKRTDSCSYEVNMIGMVTDERAGSHEGEMTSRVGAEPAPPVHDRDRRPSVVERAFACSVTDV